MEPDAINSQAVASWDLYEMVQGVIQAPIYHVIFEVALIIWIIQLVFHKSYKPVTQKLTEKEKEELIRDWQPEPLVPPLPDDQKLTLDNFENRLIDSKIGKHVTINGTECINIASMNFLGMVGRQNIEEAAVISLRKYGVGSCGPRGFYGTVDVHLELEEKLTQFMQTEEAIIYSYGFSTVASAIPAYSKRGDVIFADEGVHFAIQQGILASRSRVEYFRHNDVEDLERLLQIQAKEDKKNPKKAKVTRRFLVIEGLYVKYGDICPLPKLVELKEKYKVRIFMDETVSFGTLGEHGRGVTEHFNIPVEEIDQITASLENSLGSSGGFCCGKAYVIDHQRLSGLGYCFSASTPPMLSQAAITALGILKEDPGLVAQLQDNCQYMHEKLSRLPELQLIGKPLSPVLFLERTVPSGDRATDTNMLWQIVQMAEQKKVAITLAAFLDKDEHLLPPPRIRVTVNSELSQEEMDGVATVISDCAKQVFASED